MTFRHVLKLIGNGREDKEERRGSPDAVRDSGNGVRSRPGTRKKMHTEFEKGKQLLEFGGSEKRSRLSGFENQIQKTKER
jgi:hypothetical protein